MEDKACRRELELKDSPNMEDARERGNAEWKGGEEGLQSKVWSLSLLVHDHLVTSSSFGLIFFKEKVCFNGAFGVSNGGFKREKDGGDNK